MSATMIMKEPAPANSRTEPLTQMRLAPGEIDRSCRPVLLLLFSSAMLWLALSLVLLLIASIKLHGPGFLAGAPWLTLGRIRPAGMNALLYGFCSQAALGVMLWMFCRLGGNRLVLPSMAIIGGVVWNLGVSIGVLLILAGASTGFEWLEMPGSVAAILLAGYALLGASAGVSFHFRQERELYVSQWYLLAALFWFPWVYSVANLLLLAWPVRGTVQSIVNAWFANNFLGLWMGAVALAAIFYFIPKLSGRPLYSWWLAVFGFWTLAFFHNWAGLTPLVGGPVPAWMISVSIAANVCLVVPLLASVMNWHFTWRGAYRKIRQEMTLRYIGFGALSYLIASVMGIILGLREVSAWTHFTYLELAQSQLAILGFVGMTLLGAIYHIIPRLVGRPWPAKGWGVIYWLTAGGVTLVFLALSLGGLVQGAKLSQPTLPFINVLKATIPFVGLATVGYLLLLAGQIWFLLKIQSVLRRQVQPFGEAALDFLLGAEPGQPEVKP